MCSTTRPDRIRNKSVKRSLGVMNMAGENEKNRSRWFVDVFRKIKNDEIVKKKGEIRVEGK